MSLFLDIATLLGCGAVIAAAFHMILTNAPKSERGHSCKSSR